MQCAFRKDGARLAVSFLKQTIPVKEGTMQLNPTSGSIRTGIAASLLALAIAGCGGGGGSSTPPTDNGGTPPTDNGGTPPTDNGGTPAVGVGSISLPAANGIAIIGQDKVIGALVRDENGALMVGQAVTWSSGNPAVMTVAEESTTSDGTAPKTRKGEAQGIATGLAAGDADITATAGEHAAGMRVTVHQAPTTLDEFKAMFAYQETAAGGFIVGSDISDAYSAERLEHLTNAWTYFAGFFPTTPGSMAEMYYTSDRDIVEIQGGVVCPGTSFAGLYSRGLRTCEDNGHLTFLVAPELDEETGRAGIDEATALATLSQGFMDKLGEPNQLYGWPWLWEGLSIAFRSGEFDAGGNYTMAPLTNPERADFQAGLAAGTLLPLSQLVALTRDGGPGLGNGTWYDPAINVDLVEAQSAMLMNYLFSINEQDKIQALMADIGDPGLVTGTDVFNALLGKLGKSEAELETEYRAYGQSL